MAMPKAGVSLVVENDQQFKAALSEVNAGLRVNKQQMQLVTEQTREMDDRQAALQQRYEAAQQTLQSYRDKVQVLQQAYENSARREGEASKTTMEWRASLISAQTEVAKQESLLRDLSSGQETARKTTASLADVVNGLANALGISLPPGLQTAVDKLDGFSASGAAAVTVVGGLVGALASSTMDMSKTADDLLTLSTQTGLTTDQLQEFEYASELVDVSTDTLQGSLVKLTNNMQTAATGTGSAAEAFKTLKVKVADSQGHVSVNCGTLPIGSYQWRVVAKSSVGTTHTSSWVQCTNVEVPVSVKGTTPAAGASAPRAVTNRFSWVFSVDSDDRPGDVTQQSATLHFKANNESDWHEVAVAGSQQYTDVPANTFAEGATTLDWYVVAIANTGTKVTSDTINVSTLDTLSTPVAVSPAGEYMDDAVQGITFVWKHANITGTAQTGWELSYSADSGASYTVLASANNADNSYQADAGTFSSGVIYWRVRTKNTDGAFGSYSGAAIFAIRRAPLAPVISYYDNKPLAKMRWQAKEQDGYEVAVDGISLGVRYGTGKEWQSDAVLTDGKHTLQVRIYNTYGDVSPWSSCEINVQNQPGAALAVYAEERWGEVLLCWGADNGYILRDGELIAKAEGGTYTERTSAAAHQYIVRVFDAEGYYTDSAPVLAAPSVPYAAIGLRDGTDWLAMKYATSYQNYSKAVSLGGSYQQYWGKERPVWHDAGNRVVTHTISHACKREEELLVLRSLAGQEVIYKDRDGHLAIGVFKDLQESREHGCTTLSFSITETQQEAVKYDPV